MDADVAFGDNPSGGVYQVLDVDMAADGGEGGSSSVSALEFAGADDLVAGGRSGVVSLFHFGVRTFFCQ